LLFCTRWTVSPEFRALTHVPVMIETGRFNWPISPLSTIVLGAATLVIFVRDLVRDRREKQRMALELEAARAVQQVLIPDRQPSSPGISIQSVYKPFGEVGGDFFQILPMEDGGVMVVIGDVSGKGLPAAMMVALLVGTLNTLAERTSRPAEMLAGLNRRVLGRSGGGFTTCLVTRIDPGGELTLASAGHLPPYLDGCAVELECGLPLGIAAGVEYSEKRLRLEPGQRLTLITDGVLEARDPAGALFGFERTAAISAQTADQIAKAAERFGQDDDITVLTVVRSLQVVNE
jgi:serine phosphatase RsbU (regulator of sigma subunit)